MSRRLARIGTGNRNAFKRASLLLEAQRTVLKTAAVQHSKHGSQCLNLQQFSIRSTAHSA